MRALRGSNVLQNEYYTWLKHDKHSGAFTVLLKPDARRMASLLNLGDPSREPLCLQCHATYVPDAELRGEKFDIEDGVSCESCHGAAGRWLESHAVAGATHAENRARGLTDTVSLTSRAALCLSCHYGDGDKRVTHDLYGAGHPRLSFELDTFGVMEPKHWVIDDDYLKRKGPYVPVAAWIIGQQALAEGIVRTLSSPELSRNGMFPELSVFDCYSCHHSLSEEQWKRRTYGGKPGRLAVNIAPLLMIREALVALNQPDAPEFAALVSTLHDSYQSDGAPQALARLQALLAGSVGDFARRMPGDEAASLAIMRQLASFGAQAEALKYEAAEQIGMGIQAAMATSPRLSAKFKAPLDRLFVTLESARSFSPAKFKEAASQLALKLS